MRPNCIRQKVRSGIRRGTRDTLGLTRPSQTILNRVLIAKWE